MKTINQFEVGIPVWAMSYLINNDASGLEDGEIQQVDEFMACYYAMGHVIIGTPDENHYFSTCPAFGLPCDVFECTILIMEG